MKKIILVIAILITTNSYAGVKQNFDLGFTNTNGNTKTTNIDAKYKIENQLDTIKYDFTISAYGAMNSSSTTAENYHALFNIQKDLVKDWLTYANANWEKDRFKNLDGKYSVGIGAGRTIFKTDTQNLDLKLGVSYNYEKFTTAGSRSYASSDEELDYKNKLNDISELFTNLKAKQNLGNFKKDYTIDSIIGVNFKVATNLSLVLEYDINFDNLPAGTASKTDTKSIVKLSYQF